MHSPFWRRIEVAITSLTRKVVVLVETCTLQTRVVTGFSVTWKDGNEKISFLLSFHLPGISWILLERCFAMEFPL